MVYTNTLLLYCSSVHREGHKTIQQVVEMACKGDVKGYLQLTDHIIQQIKWAEVGPDQPQLEEVRRYTFTQKPIKQHQ